MVNLTEKEFQAEVLDVKGLVLVDFWAPWCGPCRMLAPTLEQIAAEHQDTVKMAKVNVDENPNLAGQYGVMSIPTVIFFKDGRLVDQFVGVQPKAGIEGKLERWSD